MPQLIVYLVITGAVGFSITGAVGFSITGAAGFSMITGAVSFSITGAAGFSITIADYVLENVFLFQVPFEWIHCFCKKLNR
jgi:hypothetical protein